MKICLIGKNLTNFVLAKNLANKNINVDIICDKKKKIENSQRTLGISKDNFDFLLNVNKKMKISAWPIKNIKIYNDKSHSKEFLEFNNKNKKNFFLVKYIDILNSFEKFCKKNKNIKMLNVNYQSEEKQYYLKKKYKLIINSDKSNNYNKKYLNKKIEKNYNSVAYTGILIHEKKVNYEAIQIFTKYGPLAFLPLSTNKTSIVFSILNDFKLNREQIYNLIKKYNFKYKIKKINELEKFNLKLFMPRTYVYDNILFFGDILHNIHPLAGQGFNMTIRDIKLLSSLIDEKIELGIDLDESLFYDFQNKTKHLNYLFGTGIDFIHEFFKLDNKANSLLSNSIFSILGKSKLFKKYAYSFADKGINI
ncbi:MAG: FAD-dependent monooxygenase [Candidatus Pelagibacter sp.]